MDTERRVPGRGTVDGRRDRRGVETEGEKREGGTRKKVHVDTSVWETLLGGLRGSRRLSGGSEP